MRFKAVSDKGNIRKTNEDNYYIDQDKAFFMVADGMGGHAAGEVASQIAAEVSSDFDFNLETPVETMENLINKANQAIINESREKSNQRGMGTTFSSVIIEKQVLYYANLGDSRIYIFDAAEEKLQKISKDHSLVGQLLRDGKITEEEAFKHPKKNIVTQALGLDRELDIDSGKYNLAEDDLILLCTDGLSDLIRREDMQNIIINNDSIEKMAEKLLEKALSNGGTDNITFIIIKQNNN